MLQPRILPVERQQRVTRRPRHHFTLKHRPYQIQPFMIAPVLPGETMNSAVIQARAKTSPLAAAVDLQGWWLEHYLFYVKLTDLANRADWTEMLLDFTHDLSARKSAGGGTVGTAYYHGVSGINWAKYCVDRIVEEYFRDEGEGTILLGGTHQASIMNESWLDSAKLASAVTAHDDEFPGQDPVIPDGYAGNFSAHYTQWEHMRAMKLTAATFEDWVAAFGIKTDTKEAKEDYKPELLRYSRDWQYPSTVVDGGTASSTSAVIWSISERADKRRLFKEPGFVVGVTVARPKVYLSGQRSAAVVMMDDAYAWLPAVLREQAFTSLKQLQSGATPTGPLAAGPSEAYWVDLKDLLLYGDQFANFDVSATPAGFVALPTAAMEKRFAASADIDKLFASAAVNTVKQDGVCSLDILSVVTETT